jgi:LPS sulfotransferase NodH
MSDTHCTHGHGNTRVRAIILATQRTGSTFLVECLQSHPEIECSGEILNGALDVPVPTYRGPLNLVLKGWRLAKTGSWMPRRRLDAFYGRGSAKVRCFKIMYNHLSRPFVLRYFLEFEDVRVMHLRRHNLLKVHVSTLLMDKRREVHATAPKETVWIRVNPAKAIASMRKARALYEAIDKTFERHPRLQIGYESLFDGKYLQADTCRRICDFLGVQQHRMESQLVKLNPESLRDMVINYDELEVAISRTEFANMLD